MGEEKCIVYDSHIHMGNYFSKSLLFFRCFVDAIYTSSPSRFLTRTEDNRLRFQFEAFMFSDFTGDAAVSYSSIYCHKPNATKLQQ